MNSLNLSSSNIRISIPEFFQFGIYRLGAIARKTRKNKTLILASIGVGSLLLLLGAPAIGLILSGILCGMILSKVAASRLHLLLGPLFVLNIFAWLAPLFGIFVAAISVGVILKNFHLQEANKSSLLFLQFLSISCFVLASLCLLARVFAFSIAG